MAIELDEPPQAPELPSGLVMRPMDLDEDWEIVGPVMDAAFADHWGTVSLEPDPEPAGGAVPDAGAPVGAAEQPEEAGEPEDES